jgi:hypothetical protein
VRAADRHAHHGDQTYLDVYDSYISGTTSSHATQFDIRVVDVKDPVPKLMSIALLGAGMIGIGPVRCRSQRAAVGAGTPAFFAPFRSKWTDFIIRLGADVGRARETRTAVTKRTVGPSLRQQRSSPYRIIRSTEFLV